MKKDNIIEMDSTKFAEWISLNQHKESNTFIKINGPIELTNTQINSLYKCVFLSDVYIKFDYNCNIRLLTFRNCDFKKLLSIDARRKTIDENFHNNFEIYFYDVRAKHLCIDEINLKGAYFNEQTTIGHLSIKNKSEIKFLIARDSNVREITVEDSTLSAESGFHFSDINTLEFNNSKIDKLFVLENSFVKGKLSILRSNIAEITIFNQEKNIKEKTSPQFFPIIDIIDSQFSKRLTLTKSKNFQNYEIDNINIWGNNSGQIEITGAKIRETYLNDRGDVNFVFKDCSFNHFRCVGLKNKLDLLTINSLGKNSIFSVTHSVLKQSYFHDVDLHSFSKLNFEKSDLSNLTNCMINWFHDDQIESNETDKIKKYAYKRELYRQLKNNQEKQGDRIKALEFQSKEMHYFREEKKLSGKKESNRRHWWEDYVILNIGRINNHGQSFFKPILFLGFASLGFTFLLHAPEIISKISIPFDTTNSNETKKLAYPIINPLQDIFFSIDVHSFFKIWISTLNPVHDISEIYENVYPHKGIAFYELAIDFLLKVSEAILIFQIIIAFRKYVRQ